MAKGGEEDARTIWIFFAFFCGLDLRAATDLARGQRWVAWKWLHLTFCGVDRSNYIILISIVHSCVSLAPREFLATTHRNSVNAPLYYRDRLKGFGQVV